MNGKLNSDKSLVAKLRSGDELAATHLYERYAERVFGLVNSRMSDKLRSQLEPVDIVQSVFKSMFRGVMSGGYDAPDGGTLWKLVAVIAVNKVRRNATHRSALKRSGHKTVSMEVVSDQIAMEHASDQEMERALWEAVEGLDELTRRVVLLRVEGYTVEQISELIERSRRTVERLLQSARRQLAEDLQSA